MEPTIKLKSQHWTPVGLAPKPTEFQSQLEPFLSVFVSPGDHELPEGLPLVSTLVPAKSFVYSKCSTNGQQSKWNLVLKASQGCFVACALVGTPVMENVWASSLNSRFFAEKRTWLGWWRWWCPKRNLSLTPHACSFSRFLSR